MYVCVLLLYYICKLKLLCKSTFIVVVRNNLFKLSKTDIHNYTYIILPVSNIITSNTVNLFTDV